MYFLPQAAIGFVQASTGLGGVDAWGQSAWQQPVQFVGVLPTFSTVDVNMPGFAQGIAGMALGGGAAWGNSNGSRRPRRQKRQSFAKEEQSAEPTVTDEEPEEIFHECQDGETWDAIAADPESTQEEGKMHDLVMQLEEGGEARRAAIESLHGSVLDLAFDPAGCRVVQLALEVANQKDAGSLALELVGQIRAAIDSKHANHVVQKVIEKLPPSMTTFMTEELLGAGGELARHAYGCRIICRLIEHSAAERAIYALINELLMEAKDLSRHAYGHHVMRCILEHGLPEHRCRIANALCGGLQRSAKHRHASFVVEKALAFCDEPTRERLANELLARPEDIADLARHQYGRHVVSQLVRAPGDCSQRTIDTIHIMRPQVQSTKHGRRLLAALRPQLEVSATT